jgi:carbonic anhydrase
MTVERRVVVCAAIVVCALMTAVDAQAPLSPRDALGLLKAGNDRFARNASSPVSVSVNRRRELASAQHPMAMVLSCADSRVPPEYIFNAGLGELFVIRTAGEVIDRSILATVEYGAEHLHIPLLVVMGHESCGAVSAAVEAKTPAASPNLDYLLKAIQAGKRAPAEDRDEIKTMVLANVEQVINDALNRSALLKRLVDENRLDVIGGYYELVSGRVMFSEPVSSPRAVSQESHR